ncbi:MAG: hypothetical protein WC799_08480 [Desulfobacteraceae bacterium]|jgi:hypothetical protein
MNQTIRDLNFLNVNYLQRNAIIDDNKHKMLKEATDGVKEIIKILSEKFNVSSVNAPRTVSEPLFIPAFFVEYYDSGFMKQLCNSLNGKSDNTKPIKKISNSKFFKLIQSIFKGVKFYPSINLPPIASESFQQIIKPMSQGCNSLDEGDNTLSHTETDSRYFQILLFAISMQGKNAIHTLRNPKYYLDAQKVDELNNLLFNPDIDNFIELLKNKLIDPYEDYFVEYSREYSYSERFDFVKYNSEGREVIESFRPPVNALSQNHKRKLADIVRMNEIYERIKDFSQECGRYDAYSLTAYHNIEYYVDLFMYNIFSEKVNITNPKNLCTKLLYPKCYHESDMFINENTFYIKKGNHLEIDTEIMRFIGLLIWDVNYTHTVMKDVESSKKTVAKAIKIVKNWFDKKYGQANITNMTNNNMAKYYRITNQCINQGRYLTRPGDGVIIEPELEYSMYIGQLSAFRKSCEASNGSYKMFLRD